MQRLQSKLLDMEARLNAANKWQDLDAMGEMMDSFIGDPAFGGCVSLLGQAARL